MGSQRFRGSLARDLYFSKNEGLDGRKLWVKYLFLHFSGAIQTLVSFTNAIKVKAQFHSHFMTPSLRGKRENGRARGRHVCLVLARPFFFVPTTSKRLLPRLPDASRQHWFPCKIIPMNQMPKFHTDDIIFTTQIKI